MNVFNKMLSEIFSQIYHIVPTFFTFDCLILKIKKFIMSYVCKLQIIAQFYSFENTNSLILSRLKSYSLAMITPFLYPSYSNLET